MSAILDFKIVNLRSHACSKESRKTNCRIVELYLTVDTTRKMQNGVNIHVSIDRFDDWKFWVKNHGVFEWTLTSRSRYIQFKFKQTHCKEGTSNDNVHEHVHSRTSIILSCFKFDSSFLKFQGNRHFKKWRYRHSESNIRFEISNKTSFHYATRPELQILADFVNSYANEIQ